MSTDQFKNDEGIMADTGIEHNCVCHHGRIPVDTAKSVPHASVSVDEHPADPQDSKDSDSSSLPLGTEGVNSK